MYAGHHPDGSGIQAHSTGSHYPLIVSATETHQDAGTPHHRVEVSDPSGAILWARITPECASRDDRIASWTLAYQAAERLAVIHRSAAR